MVSRRNFLGLAGLGITGISSLDSFIAFANSADPTRKLKLAIVTTEWRKFSHAWHMGERFLVGYPKNGQWHHPNIEVVSAYVDQFPENDLSRKREKEFGFKIYPTIAEALRAGKDQIEVDAVLIIGEHGDYPDNEYGQKKYPRYEFFKQVTDVFKKDGKAVPVFNDKHLSWNFKQAKEMVEISKELKFPFLAGSSLPVTWRMPAVDLPFESEPEEVMCLAMGGVDSYDFHALEVIQCMAERRKGGETGIKWVQGLDKEAFWNAFSINDWQSGGWSPDLFNACLCRSQTLQQDEVSSDRYPTVEQMREWVKDPLAYRFEYRDGLKGTMLLMNGLVSDFTFASKIKNQEQLLSTLFYLPPVPNVTYSAALMSNAEETFVSGKASYPVERTLLTSGLLESAIHSLKTDQKPLNTPHLNVQYQVGPKSLFERS
jgi:hypothetical protein